MATVVIASTGLSSLILSSLQQTRALDGAATAYYAAESGIEDALFTARRTNVFPPSVPAAQTLANGATWTRTVQGGQPVMYVDAIPQDSLVEAALYDPDAPTTATDIDHVQITWTDQCSGCSVLKATLVGWLAGGPIVWDPNATTYQFTGGTASLSVGGVGKLYRLRLVASGAAIDSVQIRAYNAANAPVNIPGQVNVTATGDYGGVRQTLIATFPRETPLSGVFDFVLFSECSLVKGGTSLCP